MSNTDAINQQLMAIFGFSEDELYENRAGRLTRQQMVRVRREEEGDPVVFGCAALTVVGLGMLSFVICSALFNIEVLFNSIAVLVVPALVIGVLVALGILYAQIRGQQERKTKAAALPLVAISDGRLILVSGESPSMMVGDEGFSLSAFRYERLHDLPQDHLYRVYYMPQSQSVLSMEVLGVEAG